VKARTGLGQWTGEFIATFGLILTILGTVRTSLPLSGSPPRPASPTRRSRSRAAWPTPSSGSRRTTCCRSSPRSCLGADLGR